MKFYGNLNGKEVSFFAKEHTRALGNCSECKVLFHVHTNAELLLVTDGELTLHLLGKEPQSIKSGECALIFPFQSHAYDRAEGCEYFRFNFATSIAKSFFTPNEKTIGERAVFSVNTDEYSVFFDAVRRNKVTLLKAKGFIYNILADYESQITLDKAAVDDTILGKAIAYINQHKSEELTAAKVAAALGYNVKYLSRCINQSTGFSFSTLLSVLRMEQAGYLLKNTTQTVVDIAMECGFGSERSFYRQFKNLTGLTPNEYRESTPKKPIVGDAVIKSME